MVDINFDATQVAPDTGVMDAIPAGWYNAAMDQSEMKPTKDGAGQYLECRFNILDGQYAGRKLYTRLNIRNANPVAQEIAYKQLSAICHAVGVLNVQSSVQLHNIPLKLRVTVRPATGEYEASNDIKAFRNINEEVGGAAATPAAAPQNFAPPPVQSAPPQAQQPWQGSPAPAAMPPVAMPPAATAPAQQPWQQAPQQQAPQQQAPQQAPAVEQPWQQPQAQQPWQQAPQQQAPQQQAQAAPQQEQAPIVQQPAHMAAPEGFNPQGAVPPWQQPQQ